MIMVEDGRVSFRSWFLLSLVTWGWDRGGGIYIYWFEWLVDIWVLDFSFSDWDFCGDLSLMC